MNPDEFQTSVLSELRLIRALLEKKIPPTSNDDDEDLVKGRPRSRQSPMGRAPSNEDSALRKADAVRLAVALEPLYKKTEKGSYSWQTANEAAEAFLKNKNFGYVRRFQHFALSLGDLRGRLIVNCDMFTYLERLFDQFEGIAISPRDE
jgi:hypothetical protein